MILLSIIIQFMSSTKKVHPQPETRILANESIKTKKSSDAEKPQLKIPHETNKRKGSFTLDPKQVKVKRAHSSKNTNALEVINKFKGDKGIQEQDEEPNYIFQDPAFVEEANSYSIVVMPSSDKNIKDQTQMTEVSKKKKKIIQDSQVKSPNPTKNSKDNKNYFDVMNQLRDVSSSHELDDSNSDLPSHKTKNSKFKINPLEQAQKVEAYKQKEAQKKKDKKKRLVKTDSIINMEEFIQNLVPANHCFAGKFIRNDTLFYPSYSISTGSAGIVITAHKKALKMGSTYFLSSYYNESEEFGEKYLGKIKGNFTGSQFNIYNYDKEQKEEKLEATVLFGAYGGCTNMTRNTEIYIRNDLYDTIDNNANLKTLFEQSQGKISKLVNKKPIWNDEKSCYVMSFGGKVKMASVKNTIFIEEGNPSNEVLLIAKQEKNNFLLEVNNPLSAFLAMGIAVASFDWKLASE